MAIQKDPTIGNVAKKLFERNVAKSKLKMKQKKYSVFKNARKVRALVDRDKWGDSSDAELQEYKQQYMTILDKPSAAVRATETYKVASELVNLIEKVILARERQILAPSLVHKRTAPEDEGPSKKEKIESVSKFKSERASGLPKKPRKRAKRKKKTVKAAEETSVPEETEKKPPRPLLKKYYPRSKSASKMRI